LSADRYDLAIVGAGPAGSALAIRAARGGVSALLVDRDDFQRPRFGETAPPQLRRAMAELELGHLLEAPQIGREAPAVVSVWGGDEPMERNHIASPYLSAVHLDRRQFDAALAKEAQEAGATVRLGSAVTVTADAGEGYVLRFRSGETRRSRYLAIAVGRSAGVGRFNQRRYYLNDHACVVGYLTGQPDDSRTLIEAVREGWIYAAALPGQRMVVALTTSAGRIPGDAAARVAFWRRAISRSRLIAPVVKGLSLAERLYVANSRASAARRVGGKTWWVLGDARFAPDPLSGQGLLWAFDDAGLVADGLLRSQADGIAEQLRARSQFHVSAHGEAAASIYATERRFADEPFWTDAVAIHPQSLSG
jgi:flavin-dependent dehydrogenase